MIDELPFKVVRSNGTDEVLARAMNLLIARAAYREAARLYPEDLIEPRQGARIIELEQVALKEPTKGPPLRRIVSREFLED
jgi:hypothetical protein